MTTAYAGDQHEHPLFQTCDFRGRSRYERSHNGWGHLSIRAAGTPEFVCDLLRRGVKNTRSTELIGIPGIGAPPVTGL